jgi:hypothetical protein
MGDGNGSFSVNKRLSVSSIGDLEASFSQRHCTATRDIRRVASMAKDVFWAFLCRLVTHHVAHMTPCHPFVKQD